MSCIATMKRAALQYSSLLAHIAMRPILIPKFSVLLMPSITSRCSCGCLAIQCRRNFSKPPTNPNWIAVAHNAAFEMAIEQHILGPRFGWPLIPIARQRCTMAMALALSLPAKLETSRARSNCGTRRMPSATG